MDIEYLEEYEEIVLPFSGDTAKIAPSGSASNQEIMNSASYQNCDGSSSFIFGSGSSSIAHKLERKNGEVVKDEISDSKNKQPCLVVKCSTNLNTSKIRNDYEEKYERLKKMFEPRKHGNQRLIPFNERSHEVDKNISLKDTITTCKTNENIEVKSFSADNEGTSNMVNFELFDKGQRVTSAETSVNDANNSQMRNNYFGIDSDSLVLDVEKNSDETADSSSLTNVPTDKTMSDLVILNKNIKGSEKLRKSSINSQKITLNEKIHHDSNINVPNTQNLAQCKNENLLGSVKDVKSGTKTSPAKSDQQHANEVALPCDKHLETKLQQFDQTESVNFVKNIGQRNNRQIKRNSINLNQLMKKKNSQQIEKDSVPVADQNKSTSVGKSVKLRKKRCIKKTHENIVRRLSNRSIKKLKANQITFNSNSLRSSNLKSGTNLIKNEKPELELKAAKSKTKKFTSLKSQNSISYKIENDSENFNKINDDADDQCGKTSLIKRNKDTDKKVNRKEFNINSTFKKVPLLKIEKPRTGGKIDLNKNCSSIGENAVSRDNESELNQTATKKTVPDTSSSTLSQATKASKRSSNEIKVDLMKMYNLKPVTVVLDRINMENYLHDNKKDVHIPEAVFMPQNKNISVKNYQNSSKMVISKSTRKRKLIDNGIEKTVNKVENVFVTKTDGVPNLVTKPKVFIVSPNDIEARKISINNISSINRIDLSNENQINSLQTAKEQFESRTCNPHENKVLLNNTRNSTLNESSEKIIPNTSNKSNISPFTKIDSSEPIKIPEFIVVESKFVTRNEYRDLRAYNKQPTSQSSAPIQQPIRNILLEMFELIDNERCQNVNFKKTELRLKRMAFIRKINLNYPESTVEFANIVKSYLQNVKPTFKGIAKTIKKPPTFTGITKTNKKPTTFKGVTKTIKKAPKKVNIKFNFKESKINKLTSKLQKQSNTLKSLKIDSRPSTSQYVKTLNPSSNLIMRVVQNNCEEEPESILPDSFQINSDYIKEEDEPKL